MVIIKVKQFVMAYKIEQDRIRALLSKEFESLRPVLRINTEIRTDEKNEEVYIEFNTPVSGYGKRGWLNIANWSSKDTDIKYSVNENTIIIKSDFLEIEYKLCGIQGGCPAEKDNEGCFFIENELKFIKSEKISENKEFCDCEFKWNFSVNDAGGKSTGETIPAFVEEINNKYKRKELSAPNAAEIPCNQVLGSYSVCFER